MSASNLRLWAKPWISLEVSRLVGTEIYSSKNVSFKSSVVYAMLAGILKQKEALYSPEQIQDGSVHAC